MSTPETARYLVESGHTVEALEAQAGRGSQHFLIDWDGEARESGVAHIELFVLRENEEAVGLYARSGFVVKAEVLTRLGDGAVLEDYHMQKCIDR